MSRSGAYRPRDMVIFVLTTTTTTMMTTTTQPITLPPCACARGKHLHVEIVGLI